MRAKRILALAAGLAAVGAHVHLAGADPYLIRPGDTLSQVARRLGVSVQELAAANGLDDPDFIVAGKLLVVPSDGGSATEYVVREGDTLLGISQAVGVPVTQLAAANGLDDPNWVPAGRFLSVPPVGAATGAVTGPAGSYVVRKGDVLADIASRLGVPLGQLAAANGIADPDLIGVGQRISVPDVWECPVAGASFVNDYGYVRPDGARHNGVDLFASRGTPIVAPVGGLVEAVPNNLGGQAVQLLGDDGNRYYFAHLDAYGETGEVGTGTVIGYVGNTGDARTTSPHLHFEIHDRATTVNPYPSLVAACR